ncbi:MAG: bifunctional pyr operon transcriptional regulator/uracil phosphoribosyltransferase PyrR [Candidatus Schekmanbacteria bacterium]|nr:MAG: bifunctional pyr operon transcriptional regulator/uracil phosphoribosyltransferase PyrR [Candidatus Schekmanbacteria bacterium]
MIAKDIEILDAQGLKRTITRITHQILESSKGAKELAIIGLQTRGVFIAKRIAKLIKKIEKIDIPVGTMDVSFYRDDIGLKSPNLKIKSTEIDFPLEGKTIVLVDDVLYTGRTVRSALDAIMDLGRPACVRLAVLIDRGNRELPIEANFIGSFVPTTKDESIQVQLKEIDKKDRVLLCRHEK